MGQHPAEKVSAEQLRRAAYLYVRQSTLRQVLENTTSTERQNSLRGRALSLGWAADQVVVIDDDLGRSGASSEGREGAWVPTVRCSTATHLSGPAASRGLWA